VTIWIVVTAAFAVGDWVAVATRNKRLEYVCKPATMVALAGVALALDPRNGTMRAWFVVAVLLSLVGDVFLMLPSDQFVFGLGSFLLAHIAYVVGLRSFELWAALIVAVLCVLLGVPIVRAARRDDPSLVIPVVVYIGAIGAMVTAALSTGRALAAVGALLFMASDATIAWNRFVKPLAWAPLFIIVTYHLGQAGLVLSLR
jgi:uncharacterized membrane protein YhhN